MSKLYLTPTPVGNLEDMTFRAVEVLKSVDTVLCEDTRTSARLLRHYGIVTPCKAYHAFNEHKVCEQVVGWLRDGQNLAVITDAGTPGISDPGFLLVRACVENDIEVECLPGATAFVPALVQSGFACEKFVFEGFLPHQKGRNARLEELKTLTRTFILYESPHRIAKTLRQLAEVLGAERRCCLCREISKVFAESKRGTLGGLASFYAENEPKGEMVLVVEGSDKPVYSYRWPRPAVTTDFILLALLPDGSRHLLLVERGNEPYKGCWALPGGFVEPDETLERCAARELREETGIRLGDYDLKPLPFRPYSDPKRDPRGRTISNIYYAVLTCDELPTADGADDAARASWFNVESLPALAFDHDTVWKDFCETFPVASGRAENRSSY